MSSDYVLAIHDECVLQVAGKKGKTNRRGLATWVKDEGFCSVWIQDAADFYTQTIGRVPVVAGVLSKLKGKGKFTKGCTRGQLCLVRAVGSLACDHMIPFVVVMAAFYCHVAKPPVEEGTDAANSVLAVMLLDEGTRKQILSTARVLHVKCICQR